MGGHFSALLAADSAPHDGTLIPVTVLTGFLGSGKTTLLNRLLKLPDLQGTAVIVNEFGAVGIDHHLVAATHEDTVLLANGCLCCAVRGDLVQALVQLLRRPQPPARVLLETSGLADPGPILRTLMSEPAVRARFRLAGMACTLDAVQGLATLTAQPEAARQLAVADAVFLTKADLLDALTVPHSLSSLLAQFRTLNPGATLHEDAQTQALALRDLLRSEPNAVAVHQVEAAPAFRGACASAEPVAEHGAGIQSHVIVRTEPLSRDGFAAWLDMVIAMRGEDMLRIKGIVNLLEQPDRPMVFHGVQHLFHPPQMLARWPSEDRRTRIVLITRGVDVQALDESLSVMARRRSRRPPAVPD